MIAIEFWSLFNCIFALILNLMTVIHKFLVILVKKKLLLLQLKKSHSK